MPSYKILNELPFGSCEVELTADDGYSEVQRYPLDEKVLALAAQHFDAERKKLVAPPLDEKASRLEVKAEVKVFEVVDVPEDLEA